MREDKRILLAAQRDAADDDPDHRREFMRVGTIASVLQLLRLPDGTVKVLVEGNERARISSFTGREDYYEAHADLLPNEIH